MSNKSSRSKNRSRASGEPAISSAAKAAPKRSEKGEPAALPEPIAEPIAEKLAKRPARLRSDQADSWRGFVPWGAGVLIFTTLLVVGAMRLHGAFQGRLREARQAVAEKRLNDAEEIYRELVAWRPDDLGAAFELANLLLGRYDREGDPSILPDTWELYETVDRFSGFHAEARLGMVEIALALGENDLAGKLLATLADRDPTSPRVRLRLAQLFKREKMWSEAAYFLASLVRDPSYGPTARQEMDELERVAFGEVIKPELDSPK
jgi:tetratricopeptide (TPR) repeat protein